MATGDILSAVVRADGWSMDVTIEGFTTGATYDFGSLGDSPATTTAPNFTVTVVSEGYSAAGVLGTITRTLYGTKVVRKPYPNQANNDETISGTDLVVRVALNESIYNDDKNGGAGTSGTNPVVTIAAGWATNTGGAAQTSAVATDLACTNNSTLDYPKAIAQWAWGHTPAWQRVEANFTIGALALHGHGIACVALSATGASSAVVTSDTVTATSKHRMSASGLYYESYDLAVPVAGYTQGENITLKFVAYPLVGDADSVIDTSANTTATDDIRGLTQITCTCDKTGALKDYAVVAADGNDTTGAKSTTLATAAGTPYLTIGKALASGANVIYCRTGTFDWLGSTPVSVAAKDYMIEVSPYPGETALLERQSTWKAYKATKLMYRDFTDIKCVHASGYLDGGNVAGAKLWFQSCTFTTTTKATIGNGYRSAGCWYVGCSLGADDYEDFSTSRIAYSFTGNLFTAPNILQPVYGLVANSLTGALTANAVKVIEKSASTGNPAPAQDNLIMLNNKIMSGTVNSSQFVKFGANSDLSGLAIIGNVMEVAVLTASTAALWVGGDGALTALDNVIIAHNTVVGERSNLFYNDTGSAANVRTNTFVQNNALRSLNIKTDTFVTEDAARVGNWAQVYGVNWKNNRYDGAESSLYAPDYLGVNGKYVDAPDSTRGQLGFTTDASSDGTGAGAGDYTPTAASVLSGHTIPNTYINYDLLGTALNAEIGAIQRAASAGAKTRGHIGAGVRIGL